MQIGDHAVAVDIHDGDARAIVGIEMSGHQFAGAEFAVDIDRRVELKSSRPA